MRRRNTRAPHSEKCDIATSRERKRERERERERERRNAGQVEWRKYVHEFVRVCARKDRKRAWSARQMPSSAVN